MIKKLKKIYLIRKSIKNFGVYLTSKLILKDCIQSIKMSKIDLSKEHLLDINGYKLYTIPNDQGISTELLAFGIHEPIHTRLLSKELKKGMYCLDIGANIGYYALLENKFVGKEGKVIAIEPSPENFRHLQKNVELQDDANIEIYNLACGDQDGIVKFSVSDRSNWSRVITSDEEIIHDKIKQVVDVQIRRIDTFLKENPISKLDIIRMDVEGFEYQVINGISETIKKFYPLIIMEFHGHLLGNEKGKEMLVKLKHFGYNIRYYFPREIDMPKVGTINHAKKMSIDLLIENWDSNKVPKNFTIFLKHD